MGSFFLEKDRGRKTEGFNLTLIFLKAQIQKKIKRILKKKMNPPSSSSSSSSSLWVGIAPKVPSRKALNEIRAQWRTGRPGQITDTSYLEKKAWKKQLQADAEEQEKEREAKETNGFNFQSESLIGKRYKDFHPSLPLIVDNEWCGHTFASFSHRFYLTTHMSQTTSKAVSQTKK